MTDKELKLCEEIKKNIQDACRSYEFAQAPMIDPAPWMQDAVQKVMDTIYANNPAWVTLDQENNTIVFSDGDGFDPQYLPMLPVLFKEISPDGKYELKVGDTIIGEVVYKGYPDPPKDERTVRVGAVTEVHFYQRTEMVTIDINMNGDKS